MADPILNAAQAQDIAAQLGRDSLSAEDRHALSGALVAWLAGPVGRETVSTVLGRVDTRLDVDAPLLTRLERFLAREVELLDAARLRAEGRQKDGSRILTAASSRPGVAFLSALATAIASALTGWALMQGPATATASIPTPYSQATP